jgi:hypothetical protein
LGAGITQARTSVDFLIDGAALLARLVNAGTGHADFMGCFVRGFAQHNQEKLALLAGQAPPETDDGRVLLYVCPACGEIRCGSYAAKVQVGTEAVEWSDFAYENGYEPAKPLAGLGPFVFGLHEYTNVITRASAA